MPELSQTQIENLARPLVCMSQAMTDFYKNPDNEKRFLEWCAQKNKTVSQKKQAKVNGFKIRKKERSNKK